MTVSHCCEDKKEPKKKKENKERKNEDEERQKQGTREKQKIQTHASMLVRVYVPSNGKDEEV